MAVAKWEILQNGLFLLFEINQQLQQLRIKSACRKRQFTEGERTWDMVVVTFPT